MNTTASKLPPLATLGPFIALLLACGFFALQSDRFLTGQNFAQLISFSEPVTAHKAREELRRSVGSEISEKDLKNTIILNAKALIEKDADFAKFAGRIQLTYIYEEVLGWSITRDGVSQLKEFHRAQFAAYVDRGIAIGRLSPDLRKYNLAKLADALDPMADLDFELLGVQTMYDRYLIIDKTVKPARRLETPQFFWMRVAMGLFLREEKSREDWVIRLHALYKSRRFCSSTPTLFNSGTLHSQLSSCYLYQVNDTIESIMIRGIAENAFLSKWAGGLGGSWTSVRGTGSYIKGTNGESQGIIPFLKLHNDQLVAVNQGGKRRGSGCAYLETWHNDIEDFLELRKNTGDERRRSELLEQRTRDAEEGSAKAELINRQSVTMVETVYPVMVVLGVSIIVAAVLALVLRMALRFMSPTSENTSMLFLALVAAGTAVAAHMGGSAPLAALLAGMLLKQLNPRPWAWPRQLGTAASLLTMLMFVLVSTVAAQADWSAPVAGVVGAVILARLVAKTLGVAVGNVGTGANWRQAFWVGCAMAPMSSVALLIASQFVAAAPELGAQIAGVALPTILVMEVLGAALATVAIYRSGESSRPWKPLSRSNTAGDERES